ncbi:uncharacterized protein LOC117331765 [Pecten maximus]|uniref:uncharacterized protein LOC117331765 n=1 Tax=Pecten maximus TaxID=6579 RepID=UPI0014581249|nr:uncharacterized protein LOC117331765 [Pecten maximus]
MITCVNNALFNGIRDWSKGMELTGRELYRKYLRFANKSNLLQSSLKWFDNVGLFDGVRKGEYTVKLQEFIHNTGLKQSYVSAMVQSLLVSRILDIGCYGEVDFPEEYADDLIDVINECEIAPELENVVDVMYACARIGSEGYTPEQRSLVWRAIILDEALEVVKTTIERSEGVVRKILDINCSHGDLTMRLAEEFPAKIVHGCDISTSNIQHCNTKSYDTQNVTFFTVPSFTELSPNWSKTYDVVTLLQAVPHDNTNTKEIILEAARIVQDDGHIIYIEPEVDDNPRDNKFPESAYDHAVSYWYRIPSGDSDVSESDYQVDNTENFLRDCGLRVEGHHLIHCSIRNHAFVCVKD